MARKKPQPPEGAPEWMVTYGDMMTLLLCFFVMIVAMSEIKKDETKYIQAVASIQKVFGYRGGIGAVPTDLPPEVSPARREMAQMAKQLKQRMSKSADPGQQGRHTTVKSIRDGMKFTVGGTAMFEEGRAELLAKAHGELREIADRLRGYRLKIEVRGHTSSAELPANSPFKSNVNRRSDDHMGLSIARAKAVRDFLIGLGPERGRIDSQRIRVTGVGDCEPLVDRAYEPDHREKNDRVEIIVTEALVEDFEGPAADASSDGVNVGK